MVATLSFTAPPTTTRSSSVITGGDVEYTEPGVILGMLAHRLMVPSAPPNPGQISPDCALTEISLPSEVEKKRRLMHSSVRVTLVVGGASRATLGTGAPGCTAPVTMFCGTGAACVVTSAALWSTRLGAPPSGATSGSGPVAASGAIWFSAPSAVAAPSPGSAAAWGVAGPGGAAGRSPGETSWKETPRQVMCCVVCVGGCFSLGSKRHFSSPVTGLSAITVLKGVQM